MGSVPGEPTAVTAQTTLAVGGERQVPVPDPVARDYLLLALRLDQHMPGPRRRLLRPGRPQGAGRPRAASRAHGRLARMRPRSSSGSTREVAEPDRRDWLTGQVVALRAQAEVASGVDRCRTWSSSSSCSRWTPVRRDEALFDEAAAEIERLLARRWPARRSARGLGRAARGPAATGCPPSSTGSWGASAIRPRPRSACPTATTSAIQLVRRPAVDRLQLVRRRPSVAVRPQPGPADPRRRSWCTSPPTRRIPGHHLEHAWKEAELVTAREPDGGEHPPDQHAGVPDQRGPRRSGLGVRRPGGRRDRPARGAVRSGRPAVRRRSGSGPRRRGTDGRARGAPATAQREPGQRRAHAPRRRPGSRRGPGLARAGRAVRSGGRGEAPRVHRAPDSGGRTCSSTTRARRCSGGGSMRCRNRKEPPGSGGSSASSWVRRRSPPRSSATAPS